MAEAHERRREEIADLRLGLDVGMTLVDIAEVYGEGDAERLVGEAIAGRRDEVFPVSKALPFPRPAAAPSTHAGPASADCGPTGSICTSSTWPSRR